MTRFDELDQALGAWFDGETLAPAPAGLLDRVTAATARRRPRPRWQATLHQGSLAARGSIRTGAAPVAGALGRKPAIVLALGLLLLALVAVAAIVGSRLLTPSDPVLTTYEGALVPAGPLPEALRNMGSPTGVLLDDGRMLIRGASGGREVWGTWDLATGEFADVGPGAAVRSVPDVLLHLLDGKVLIMGGDLSDPDPFTGSQSIAHPTAEVYDPVSGSFTSVGPLIESRWAFRAVTLADGRVLVAGGRSVADSSFVSTAEIFDPVTGTFSPTGSMSIARGGQAMARLEDGRVLVVGGVLVPSDSMDPPVLDATAEIYDPVTGTFSMTGSMHEGRVPLAVPLAGGRVLVMGGNCHEVTIIDGHSGRSPEADPTTTEIYDPASGTFGPGPTVPHCVETATSLPNGQILLTGWWDEVPPAGTDPLLNRFHRTWSGLLDPASGLVRETAAPAGTRYQAVMLLTDGRVLVVGENARDRRDAECCDPVVEIFQ